MEKHMLKNFKLTIEYDGSSYHGWQIQKDDHTIQGEIEKAVFSMTGKRVRLIAAGRTDAGVHAFGQVANFFCDTRLTHEILQGGLNSLLPGDIVVKSCVQVDEIFHARHNAKSKTYQYRILNRSIPAAICRQYTWFIRKQLDTRAMRSAIAHIIGTHDFKAFEASGSPRSHTTRSVMGANLVDDCAAGHLVFNIRANGFLRYMVRNIVGTLVEVGCGKITPDSFKEILQSKNRKQAGATAPAHGLFLMNVQY
jgi:tRNA pseudouridine38-40 synthase